MTITTPRTRCTCGGVIFIEADVCDSCGQDTDTIQPTFPRHRITELLAELDETDEVSE